MLSGSILFTVEPCFCCSQCWGLDVKCTRQVQMFEHLVLGWCAVLRNCGTFRRQGLPRGSTGWGVEQASIFIAQLCFLSFLLPNLLRNEPVASHSCCSQECLPLPCLPCQDVATINLTSINLPLATITMTKEHNNSEFIYCCKSLGIILIASIAPSSEAESILRICFLGWYCVTLFLGRDRNKCLLTWWGTWYRVQVGEQILIGLLTKKKWLYQNPTPVWVTVHRSWEPGACCWTHWQLNGLEDAFSR